jgi:hypothetical protein
VVFSPSGDGLRVGSIVVSDDAPNSPQSIALTGTGSGPSVKRTSVTVAPQLLSFASITVGTTSVSQNIIVTSSGSTTLHISNITLGGANASDFAMTNLCNGSSYAPGATCTIGLTFAPTATGQCAATLTIADDAPNSPQTVSLSGAGTASPAPGLTVASTTSLTVKAGQTATYNLQIVPNFSGGVALQCSGAPLATTCTVPPTLQVTNGSAASFAVAVATTRAAMALPVPSATRIPPYVSLRLLPVLALGTLLFFDLGDSEDATSDGRRRPVGLREGAAWPSGYRDARRSGLRWGRPKPAHRPGNSNARDDTHDATRYLDYHCQYRRSAENNSLPCQPFPLP